MLALFYRRQYILKHIANSLTPVTPPSLCARPVYYLGRWILQGKLELLARTCELRLESKLDPKHAEMMWPTVSKVRERVHKREGKHAQLITDAESSIVWGL